MIKASASSMMGIYTTVTPTIKPMLSSLFSPLLFTNIVIATVVVTVVILVTVLVTVGCKTTNRITCIKFFSSFSHLMMQINTINSSKFLFVKNFIKFVWAFRLMKIFIDETFAPHG